MQNIENDGFKVAEENLMSHIREGKEQLLQNREDILNGNIKPKDKYDDILKRLYSISLNPEANKEHLKNHLKELVQELTAVIDNKMYDDAKYLRGLILRIDMNKKNLKYIIDDYNEQVHYENVLAQIKYQLSLKLFENMDNKFQKTHSLKNQK